MKLLGIAKPEYLLRPARIFHRLRRRFFPTQTDLATAALPIGQTMQVRPGEVIGNLLLTHGTYELPLAETLWRLVEPGDHCVDVGANIGYMTLVMASRCKTGSVCAFEPHPQLFALLQRNADSLRGTQAAVTLRNCAVSSEERDCELFIPTAIGVNAGLSTLEAQDGAGERIKVRAVTLDSELSSLPVIRLMKVDVEGHELSVFRGAAGLLKNGRIRNIAFEDHHGYRSEVSTFLEGHGYRIFEIQRRFFGPVLAAPAVARPRSGWEPPNYLATLDPDEALRKAAPRGWHVI